MPALTHSTPIGTILLTGNDEGVTSIEFTQKKEGALKEGSPLLKRCAKELVEYFEGKRTGFTVPLRMEGTDFQRAVWKAAKEVPYGKTVTYGDIAKKIGREGASRAVGNALNKNPLMLMVPCHRVLPKSGKLGGFACGPEKKEWLLNLEKQR